MTDITVDFARGQERTSRTGVAVRFPGNDDERMIPSLERYVFRTARDVDTDAALALYDSVGWTAYTCQPELFVDMFRNASHVVTAQDRRELIGLVRVVGDSATIAVVQDLIVRPDRQGQGLGRELLRRALTATAHVRQTYITTDAADDNRHVVDLYEEHGFEPTPAVGLTTMALLR